MRLKIFFILLMGIFFVGFIQASLTINQTYLQEGYSFGQGIVGWADVGFTNQSVNSTFIDSFGNKISLLALLNLSFNSNYNYSLDNVTGMVNSSIQKIYFTGASFVVPLGNVEITYQINISNQTVLSGNISVGDKEGLIQEIISGKRDDLNDLNAYLGVYGFYLRSKIISVLNVSELEDKLDEIEDTYNSSISPNEYDQILGELSNLKISQISESESANMVSFIFNKNAIDLDFLADIGGGNYTYDRKDEYWDYILFWNQENIKPLITFKEISSQQDGMTELVLSYFEVSFTRPSDKVFLVVEDLEGLDFEKDYGEISKQGYTYIDLNKVEEDIVFVTTEEVDFLNLPFFIAPSFNSFSLGDTGAGIIDSEKESKVSKWVLFVLVIIFLIILFVVAYILLKTWYDRKYEDYLFKDRNHLYNLIVYINSAKRRGLTKSEIEGNLKRSRWNGEQIRYVMRKYHGKRTGLWVPQLLSKKSGNEMNVGKHKS